MSESTTQPVLFPALLRKPIHVEFSEAALSSDGGGLLLKAVDEQLGLTEALAACLRDGRQASKVKHSIRDAVSQRIFAIASRSSTRMSSR